MGKSVLLVEPGKYLGGMTTGGLGATDIGNKYAVTGLARLFYRRIGEHYNKFEQWTFPPSVATATMNRFVKDADLDVLYYRRITNAKVQNKRIQSITLEDSQKPDKKTLIQVKAKQFIDCSYEGDLHFQEEKENTTIIYGPGTTLRELIMMKGKIKKKFLNLKDMNGMRM